MLSHTVRCSRLVGRPLDTRLKLNVMQLADSPLGIRPAHHRRHCRYIGKRAGDGVLVTGRGHTVLELPFVQLAHARTHVARAGVATPVGPYVTQVSEVYALLVLLEQPLSLGARLAVGVNAARER